MQKEELKSLLDSVHLYDSEVALTLINIENLKRLGFIDTSEHIRQHIIARMIYNGRYNLGHTWERVAKDSGRMTSRNARYIHDNEMPEFERFLSEELSKDG